MRLVVDLEVQILGLGTPISIALARFINSGATILLHPTNNTFGLSLLRILEAITRVGTSVMS